MAHTSSIALSAPRTSAAAWGLRFVQDTLALAHENGVGSAGEHFGFADPISQPPLEGVDAPAYPGDGVLEADGSWRPLKPGEFVLGYEDEAGPTGTETPEPFDLRLNGTYCAATAGVDMITRCGARELGSRGIRVVGIAPGLVETPLPRHELENPALRDLFLGAIPMQRAVAAVEIAAAAVFLASDDARSITGEPIAIDGGPLTRGYPALLSGRRGTS